MAASINSYWLTQVLCGAIWVRRPSGAATLRHYQQPPGSGSRDDARQREQTHLDRNI